MKITQDGYELEINIDLETGTVTMTGEIVSQTDEGDSHIKTTTTFESRTSSVAYTRQDVLSALYKNVSSVASTFGPTSDEVDSLEDDIAHVKAGGSLEDFAWLFETE